MLNQSRSQIKAWSRIPLWDRLGITLSALCLVHCVITPILLLALPFVSGNYFYHPVFHMFLALFIVPIGTYAFWRGYQHHRKSFILWLGIPGLFLVGLTPLILDLTGFHNWEPIFVSAGSVLLVTAHWKNQRACACENHHH